MKIILVIAILFFSQIVSAQFSIPAYSIKRDSATHSTVFHSDDAQKLKISSRLYSDTLYLISPDIKIKNGVIDHKSLMGEMIVREYYVDSAMIGYIEFESGDIKRELYFNSSGDVFLEKRYKEHFPIYIDNKKHFMTIIE